jgi:signal transduction histidine kinase
MNEITPTDERGPDSQSRFSLGEAGWAARWSVLAAGIVVTGLLGQASAVTASKTSLIWLPTGIAAGLLFRWGLGSWPAVAAGIFLVQFIGHGAPGTAVGVAITGTLGTAATAWLLTRFGVRAAFDQPRDIIGLLAAAAAGMLVTATGGVFWLWLSGTIPEAAVGEIWRVWWRGDFAGVMLAAPFVISASRTTLERLGRRRWEAVAFVAVFGVTTWFINFYCRMPGEPIGAVALVIWAAMRYGILGGSLTVLACSVSCAWAVALGLGSFGSESAALFSLWTYMVAWALISLVISVIQAAGDRDRESLHASVQRLNETTAELVARRAEQEATIRSLERSEQEADRANRAKTQFLANMSHELRTPLAAMLGFADMLETSDVQTPDLAESLEGIRRNGEHLLRLVDDVLDVAKTETGRIDLCPESCSSAGIVDDVMAATAGYAASRGVPFAVEVGDGLPEACELDPARMRQVLTTLVNNAIQFSHPGSPVTLRAHSDGGERNLVFEIIDRGAGISVENQRKLFQPFSQADESMTRRHGGTGLGLCLAARIVEAMGGSIRVESSAGAGARFTVTIPVRTLTTGPLVAQRRPDA